MNILKLACMVFILSSLSIRAYDNVQEAILDSDYATVAQNYKPQETPVNIQHAYWVLADDTAKMRSNNLAFDWCKAFVSKKLIISALAFSTINGIYNTLRNHTTIDRQFLGITNLSISAMAWITFFCALIDGNKYYKQLQEKIKDAERIKFLIMNS